jgi:hypothetical protein
MAKIESGEMEKVFPENGESENIKEITKKL